MTNLALAYEQSQPWRAPQNERAWFEPDDGEEVDLSTLIDQDQFKQGLNGRFHAPIEHVIEQAVGGSGGFYRGTRRGLAALTLPLLLTGDQPDNIRFAMNVLSQKLNVGRGKLWVDTTWGTRRWMPAIYESGLEEDPATEGNEYDFLVPLTFRALSSYWSSADQTGETKRVTSEKRAFFPGPPWYLSGSSVFANWDEMNDGDATSWPVITISGPGRDVQVANSRTGQSLYFPGVTLTASDQIVIDSRPEVRDMTVNGQSLWSVAEGEFFPILKGINALYAQVVEGAAETEVSVRYYRQFHGV